MIKISSWDAKEGILPTYQYANTIAFPGMAIFQTHIIKCRNKHVQIAVLIFPYHEKVLSYYVLWPQEISLSQVSDKVVMVIC